MYICLCQSISTEKIKEIAAKGQYRPHEILKKMGIAKDCGQCQECALKFIGQVLNQNDQNSSS